MFKNQIVYYLNKYLGEYVYGLDAESLRISLWQGDVELRNLQLKPEALRRLDLPIAVKSGLLGRLTLKVHPDDGVQGSPGGLSASNYRSWWMVLP